MSEAVDGQARIRLRGNGRIVPKSVEESADPPPRVVIDLPGVASKVPPTMTVNKFGVSRVRVGVNSRVPLVTRVVIDLDRKIAYRVAPEGENELVVTIGEGSAVEPTPTPVAPPAPTPALVAPVAATSAKPADATGVATPKAVASATVAPKAMASAKAPVKAATPDVAPAPSARVAGAAVAKSEAAVAPAAEPVAVAPTVAKTVDPTPVAEVKPTPARRSTAARRAAEKAPVPAPAPVGEAASVAAPADPVPATPVAPKAAKRSEDAQASGAAKADPRALGVTENKSGFTGHPVSLDFQGLDLRAVLRSFADITGLNLVIDPAVNGTVDVALRDVPWDQALDIILRSNQLGYSVDGTIVRIAPLKVLAEEEAQKRRLVEEQKLSGELKVYTRTLNYSKAAEIEPLLKGVLSQRGRTAVDVRTNTIIVQDLPGELKRVDDLITTLDQAELQVEIEARVVLTTSSIARDLGLRFGVTGAAVPELGNAVPLGFPNSALLGGSTLTSPAGPSNVQLALGAINGSFNLKAELAALERDRKIKTLLSPRIVTQNNTKAQITRGEEIPYTTQVVLPPTAGGGGSIQTVPTVQFKTAALNLQVTPRITSANTVILEVDVDNGSRGSSVNEYNTNIAINTQRAVTTVLVGDGATTVIGGIQVNEENGFETRTPGLWRLPWVGRLFKNTSKTVTQDEIVIFITPRIIRMPATAPAGAAQAGQQR